MYKNYVMSKIKNIFITGPIHIGKSTIIKKVLERTKFQNILGFCTIPIYQHQNKKGFFITEFQGSAKRCFAHVEGIRSNNKYDVYKFDLEVFNSFGVELIHNALKSADCLLMDEIGVMEKNAKLFLSSILKALDSSIIVIGAFQERADWFKEILVERNDTIILQINIQNRNFIHRKILSLI